MHSNRHMRDFLKGGLFESELQMQNVSTEMLRDLFKFRETRSLIADSLKLEHLSAQQDGSPSANDLDQWGHHADLRYENKKVEYCVS